MALDLSRIKNPKENPMNVNSGIKSGGFLWD